MYRPNGNWVPGQRNRVTAVCRVWLWLSCVVLATARLVVAQELLSLSNAVAVPGQPVAITVSAATSIQLTGLEADIEFPELPCDLLESQRVAIAGRTSAQAASELLEADRCPLERRTSVILMDLRGAVVVPPGDGPIGEWTFLLSAAAPVGTFSLGVRVNQARNGPDVVSVSAADAELVVTRCTGDCMGDTNVTVDEIVRIVNIALGTGALGECRPGDTSLDGVVTVDEIVTSVNNALQGCPQ